VTRLVVIRLLGGVATLFAASILIFVTVELLPGDAATAFLGRERSPEAVAALRKQFGLDRPLSVRYADWISGVVRGDLGRSVANDIPVTQLIGARFGRSAILVSITLALLVPLSLAVGTLAALRQGSKLDASIQLATLATAVLPEFVVGIVFILLFAFLWHLLPAVSLEVTARSLILPTASLLVVSFAYTARMVRAGVIGVLQSEYVDMARLKGMPERLVIRRHVLPNSLVPSVQAFALTAAWMPGGIVIIESLFGYPGIGQGLVQAVASRDTVTVEALVLIIACVYIVTNLISDLFTVVMTPRLRTQLA
jgi:peptide/nickel transport system permease protein